MNVKTLTLKSPKDLHISFNKKLTLTFVYTNINNVTFVPTNKNTCKHED
jgi:hypothetical protein